MRLRFGKFKGESLNKIPADYLFWLTCWEVRGQDVENIWFNPFDVSSHDQRELFLMNSFDSARNYLIRKQLHVVWEARNVFKENGTVHTVYESCQQLVTLEKMEKITMIGRIDYCTNVVGNYYSITCDVSIIQSVYYIQPFD